MKKILRLLLLLLIVVLAGCKPTINNITITIEGNDGTSITTVVIEEGKNVGEIADRNREGYDFGGWYVDNAFTIPFDSELVLFEDTTIYGKWTPHEYTISFIGNGGTPVSPVRVKHDQKLAQPTNYTRDKYTFLGWFTDSELKNKYDFNTIVTKSFSLYAGWERVRLPLIDLEEYEVKYIVTSPGEDASTMININYQNKNKKSSVEYTLASDSNYANKKIAYPTGFGFEALSSLLEKPFPVRNINKVNITNLTPNTSYKYRINKGNNTYSDDYYFTTSGGDDTTSFLFVSDVHYYDGYDGAEIVETTIENALKIQPGIDFILSTGDMVDTGGNADDWDKLFTHSKSFKKLPFLGVPGNHEHYIISDSRNDILHAYFNFPENSLEDYYGASYYFIHNDTLFIQLDTDSPYRRADLYQWVDDVIAKNKTKFVVLGTHAPFHIPSGDTVNPDYKRPLLDIMEKHGVDLVLSGHYHSNSFRVRYQDLVPANDKIGVAYLNAAGGGIKSIGTALPEEFAKGYIVDVLKDSIKIRYINARGDILTTYNVPNHKLSPVVDATKQELFDSITGTPDLENETITFNWDQRFYGNIKEMLISEVYFGQRTVTMLVPTPGYTSYKFDKFFAKLDHQYHFKITFNDGEVLEKTLTYRNYGGMNLEVSEKTSTSAKITYDAPISAYANTVQEYQVFINGVKVLTYPAKNGTKFNTEALIENLESKKTYNLEVKVYGRNGYMFGDETTFTTK